MSVNAVYSLPSSTLDWIAKVPKNTAVAVLLRHSVRDSLPPQDVGYSLPITPIGRELAYELGVILGEQLQSLYTSPLTRCVQTAELIKRGAQAKMCIHHDRLLGDPGVFVMDEKIAFSNWHTLGHAGVMAHMVSHDIPLPGMVNTSIAAQRLVQHMLSLTLPGFHVFVTHDVLVIATAAKMLGKVYGIEEWPGFLEAAFFWQDNKNIISAYRATHCQSAL